MEKEPREDRPIKTFYAILVVLLVLMVIAWFIIAATQSWDKPNLLKPAILGLLAGLTVVFAGCLVIALYRGDELALESRWGGFGGGLGGWRASTALGLLVAVMVFGCLTLLAGSMALQPASPPTVAATATPTPTVAATATPTPTPSEN